MRLNKLKLKIKAATFKKEEDNAWKAGEMEGTIIKKARKKETKNREKNNKEIEDTRKCGAKTH